MKGYWQKIDKCPKAIGQDYILFYPGIGGSYEVAVGCWAKNIWWTETEGDPSHWMDLPSPPKETFAEFTK